MQMSEEPVAASPSLRESVIARLPEGAIPVITAFVASRLMVCGVIVLSRLQVPPGPFAARGGLLNVLTSGEAARYLQLAQNGASTSAPVLDTASAFFPVFPLLLKFGSAVFGDVGVVGIAIANLCLLAAGLLLYRLMQLDDREDDRMSRVAVILLMFSPASYFFTCALPDSTALLLAIGAVLAARTGRWIIASACALLLCGTMNIGFWIVIPLAVEYLRQLRQSDAGEKRQQRVNAALLALVALPLLAAVVYGYAKGHDAGMLLRVSPGSRATLAGLRRMSRYFDGYASFYRSVSDGAILSAALVSLAACALRLRTSYWLFSLAVAAVCWWSHDLQSIRTLGMAFPLYVAMAGLSARFDWLYEPFLTCSMVLLALCTVVAANGFWIT